MSLDVNCTKLIHKILRNRTTCFKFNLAKNTQIYCFENYVYRTCIEVFDNAFCI